MSQNQSRGSTPPQQDEYDTRADAIMTTNLSTNSLHTPGSQLHRRHQELSMPMTDEEAERRFQEFMRPIGRIVQNGRTVRPNPIYNTGVIGRIQQSRQNNAALGNQSNMTLMRREGRRTVDETIDERTRNALSKNQYRQSSPPAVSIGSGSSVSSLSSIPNSRRNSGSSVSSLSSLNTFATLQPVPGSLSSSSNSRRSSGSLSSNSSTFGPLQSVPGSLSSISYH